MNDPLHPCPGRCGAAVAYRLFACRSCWYRLPRDIRNAINASYRGRQAGVGTTIQAHRVAMADALDWYRANPLGAS